jgi:hypothetical protein
VSCELRKTNPFYRIVSVLLFTLAFSLCISQTSIAEDDSENDIQYWLTEAEKHARSIEDKEERNSALFYLAGAYAHVGGFSKAYLMAKQMPHDYQGICLRSIILAQTLQGDVASALKRTQNIREPEIKSSCLYTIAYVCAKNDISTSMKIAEQISEPGKSSIRRQIVEQHVLQGDMDKAKHITQQILDPNARTDAHLWIAAASIFNTEDIGKAITQNNLNPSEINCRLRAIAKTKLQSGKIDKAKRVIEYLPDSHSRILGYLDLTEYYLAKDDRENFNHYIDKVLKEIKRYSNPEMSEFSSFFQSQFYMRIAKLQIDAGDIEAGFATAKKSLSKGNEDSLFGSKDLSLFKGMGIDKATYGLMIQAGKIEEVRKLTQKEDGSFPREVAILLIGAYMRAGEDEKAEAILDSLTTPQDKFHLSLAIIEGINQRKANHK